MRRTAAGLACTCGSRSRFRAHAHSPRPRRKTGLIGDHRGLRPAVPWGQQLSRAAVAAGGPGAHGAVAGEAARVQVADAVAPSVGAGDVVGDLPAAPAGPAAAVVAPHEGRAAAEAPPRRVESEYAMGSILSRDTDGKLRRRSPLQLVPRPHPVLRSKVRVPSCALQRVQVQAPWCRCYGVFLFMRSVEVVVFVSPPSWAWLLRTLSQGCPLSCSHGKPHVDKDGQAHSDGGRHAMGGLRGGPPLRRRQPAPARMPAPGAALRSMPRERPGMDHR